MFKKTSRTKNIRRKVETTEDEPVDTEEGRMKITHSVEKNKGRTLRLLTFFFFFLNHSCSSKDLDVDREEKEKRQKVF